MNNNRSIKLHCHTNMSKGKGLLSPGELIRYVYDNGFKAIAITDCGNVKAFPEAYREWTKLREKHQEECLKDGKEAVREDFMKIIYGLEGNLLTEDGKVFTVLIYAKNRKGILNLYRIVDDSYLNSLDGKRPIISRRFLDEHRDGLLIGSAGNGGEVVTAIHSSYTELGVYYDKDYLEKLKEIASYYDFLAVTPSESPDSRYLYFGYVEIGNIPMIAASDVHEIDDKDSFRVWVNDDDPIELKELPNVLFDNQAIIEEQIEYISPLYNYQNSTYEYWEKLYDLEGKEVPQNDKERYAAELLRKGASYIDAKIKAGLSGEEMENLYDRLMQWESEHF